MHSRSPTGHVGSSIGGPCLSTGSDSPVSSASSTSSPERYSGRIRQSAGTMSPILTRTISPLF